MNQNDTVFMQCFGQIEDPRLDRQKRHSLLDIIAIAICAAIAGADSWTEIADFGHAKQDWLRTFLKIPNGIPAHDTFGRVFSLLDPQQFQQAFQSWVAAIQGRVRGVVAIDGKTIRRSHDQANGKQAIHVVSAWARESSLALGQVTVDEKSNEITAIPDLVRMLNLKGCLVTIDAMGCQREIAKTIIDAGADYLLAVKGNQETLAEDIETEFKHAMAGDFAHMEHHYYESLEKGHGRIERRQYWYTQDIAGLGTAERWPGLTGMVMCRATRTVKCESSVEDRYFITSAKDNDAVTIAESIRAHWSIENSLHWTLDVAFNEDQARIRIGYAAENMATIRKIALNTVKKNKTSKRGVKGKRKQAAWDNSYLEELLMQV